MSATCRPIAVPTGEYTYDEDGYFGECRGVPTYEGRVLVEILAYEWPDDACHGCASVMEPTEDATVRVSTNEDHLCDECRLLLRTSGRVATLDIGGAR